MTFEEMERTMQFILEQQAQISGNVQRHDENLLVIETQLQGLEKVVLKLADSHVLLVNSHKELAEGFKRLQQAQTESQERLDPSSSLSKSISAAATEASALANRW
jgi:hypothetical protein